MPVRSRSFRGRVLSAVFMITVVTIGYLLNRPISMTPQDAVAIILLFLLVILFLVWFHVNAPVITGWNQRNKGRR